MKEIPHQLIGRLFMFILWFTGFYTSNRWLLGPWHCKKIPITWSPRYSNALAIDHKTYLWSLHHIDKTNLFSYTALFLETKMLASKCHQHLCKLRKQDNWRKKPTVFDNLIADSNFRRSQLTNGNLHYLHCYLSKGPPNQCSHPTEYHRKIIPPEDPGGCSKHPSSAFHRFFFRKKRKRNRDPPLCAA